MTMSGVLVAPYRWPTLPSPSSSSAVAGFVVAFLRLLGVLALQISLRSGRGGVNRQPHPRPFLVYSAWSFSMLPES